MKFKRGDIIIDYLDGHVALIIGIIYDSYKLKGLNNKWPIIGIGIIDIMPTYVIDMSYELMDKDDAMVELL